MCGLSGIILLIFDCACLDDSSSVLGYGLFSPSLFKVTPNPGRSGKSMNPSFGKGSSENNPPKYGTILSAFGLRLMYSASGQLVNAYCRWYEYTLEPWGIIIILCAAARDTTLRASVIPPNHVMSGWNRGVDNHSLWVGFLWKFHILYFRIFSSQV